MSLGRVFIRLHRRLIHKLAVFHFQDDHTFDGVVVRAHGDGAGDPGEVLGRGQGLGDFRPLQGIGLGHGVQQQEISIRAQGGKGAQLLSYGRLFVSLRKSLARGDGGLVRWKWAVKYMPSTAGPPRVINSATWAPSPVRMGHVHPQAFQLPGQEGIFGVVVGGIDQVGILGLDGGDLGAEVLVAGLDVSWWRRFPRPGA